VLAEIGAGEVPRLLVFNKIDRSDRTASAERDAYGTIRAVFLSASSGDGIGLLREAIAERVRESRSAAAQSRSIPTVPASAEAAPAGLLK